MDMSVSRELNRNVWSDWLRRVILALPIGLIILAAALVYLFGH
jgi:hypothetical protein